MFGSVRAIEASLVGRVYRHKTNTWDRAKVLGQWYDPDYWVKVIKSMTNAERRQKFGTNNPMADVVTNVGFAIVTNTLVNLTLNPKYMSWGTSAGTAAVGNTTLFTEAYSTQNSGSQNQRVTSTMTQQTTTQTNDTFRLVGTLTAAASNSPITITNFGTFDTIGTAADLVTAPSGGNLYIKSDFTGIALAAADAIQFTANIKYT